MSSFELIQHPNVDVPLKSLEETKEGVTSGLEQMIDTNASEAVTGGRGPQDSQISIILDSEGQSQFVDV